MDLELKNEILKIVKALKASKKGKFILKEVMLDTNICIYIMKNKPEHIKEKKIVGKSGDGNSNNRIKHSFFGFFCLGLVAGSRDVLNSTND